MRTKSLAFLAGIIWLAAGFNVCRIRVVSWMSTDATTVVMILGCIATMVVFSRMFVRMLFQNVQRIREIELEKRKLWDIMPVKSYLIMIFMITFGVLQRRCPAVPAAFIASFYVGLGSALALAGVIYISACFCPKEL